MEGNGRGLYSPPLSMAQTVNGEGKQHYHLVGYTFICHINSNFCDTLYVHLYKSNITYDISKASDIKLYVKVLHVCK